MTEIERSVIYDCLKCVADGKVIKHHKEFHYWEFHTIFGLTVEEFLVIFSQWPNLDDNDELTRVAINNSMNNLLGYPHGYKERWHEVMPTSLDEIRRVFDKWRKNYPTK